MIDVTVECWSEGVDDNVPEDLRSDDGRARDWRDGVIMIDSIVQFYPLSDGFTSIQLASMDVTVRESVSEIKKRIQNVRNSQKNFSLIGGGN